VAGRKIGFRRRCRESGLVTKLSSQRLDLPLDGPVDTACVPPDLPLDRPVDTASVPLDLPLDRPVDTGQGQGQACLDSPPDIVLRALGTLRVPEGAALFAALFKAWFVLYWATADDTVLRALGTLRVPEGAAIRRRLDLPLDGPVDTASVPLDLPLDLPVDTASVPLDLPLARQGQGQACVPLDLPLGTLRVPEGAAWFAALFKAWFFLYWATADEIVLRALGTLRVPEGAAIACLDLFAALFKAWFFLYWATADDIVLRALGTLRVPLTIL